METIGQVIGVIEDNFKVTNQSGNEVQIKVKFDYRTVTDMDIKSWLNGNRRIAFQRPLRGLSAEEIKALDGQMINANECGRKVKSREERISELITAGIPRQLAGFAVDNPEKFKAIISNIEVDK
jgi:hypothetical protein